MNAFSVSLDPASTVADLKDVIKAKKPVAFADIDADEIVLWNVSIPVTALSSRTPVAVRTSLNEPPLVPNDRAPQNLYVDIQQELLPTDHVSDIFSNPPEKNTVHVLVRNPNA
ncbi:hypothetical protein BGZ98_005422, partial [Dissophora globulifera]